MTLQATYSTAYIPGEESVELSQESSHSANHKSTEKATVPKPSILPLQAKDNTRTGILLLKDEKKFFKLNYPTDTTTDIGGGHIMSEEEVISECCHYQLGYPEFKDELASFRQSLKPVTLQRFSAHSMVTDSYKTFDVKLPQVGKDQPLLVRARDMVRLVTSNNEEEDDAACMMVIQEHFWAKVISVTTGGIVTAICVSNLTTVQLHKGDYISFPMACVLGVVHGSYWEYKSKDKSKKKSFDENDVKMIEYQTGCSRQKAIEALLQTRGSTVQACVGLLGFDGRGEDAADY